MESSRNPPRAAIRVIWAAHKLLWKLSGRRLGTSSMGMPVMELTTRGRQTGRARVVLLSYIESPAGPIVAGTNAGMDRDPAWVHNLRADPQASIVARLGKAEVVARFLEGSEYDLAWSRFQDAHDQYAGYASVLTREVPIVRFEDRTEA